MPNTEFHVVVGSLVSNEEVFKNVLDNSAQFSTNMKEIFDDGNWVVTFEQFYEFIRDGVSNENSKKWTEEEYSDLSSIYSDWLHDLYNYEYTCSSGNKVEIVKVPHDCFEGKCIVGKTTKTIKTSGMMLEIDTGLVGTVRENLGRTCGLNNVKVYIVPDECACCGG